MWGCVFSCGLIVCSRKIDLDLSPGNFDNLSKMEIIIGQKRVKWESKSQISIRVLEILASVVVILSSTAIPHEKLTGIFTDFFFISIKGIRLCCSINVFYSGIHKIFRSILSNVSLFQGHLELFPEIGWLGWLCSASDSWHLSSLFHYICYALCLFCWYR